MVGLSELCSVHGNCFNAVISNNYVHALTIILLSILIAKFVLFFFKHVVERIAKSTKSKLDDKIVLRIETPIIIIIILVGAQLAIRKIMTTTASFENVINTFIVFVVTYMFIGITNILVKYWKNSKQAQENEEFHDEILPLIKSLTKILLTLIAVMLVLQIWGVQVGALLASVGVIGIVLGFAFQDSLRNTFGGIALITDNSLKKHDVIQLDDGSLGEVIEITLRSTKIRNYDNDFIIIPNGKLANSSFVNFAQPTPTFRVLISVNVAYGSDVVLVKEVLLSTLKGRTDILKFPKREARFVKMGDYSLSFDLLFFISNYRDKFTMIDTITTEVYNALEANGIEIPFPTHTLYEAKRKTPHPDKHFGEALVIEPQVETPVSKSKTISKKKVVKTTSSKQKVVNKNSSKKKLIKTKL